MTVGSSIQYCIASSMDRLSDLTRPNRFSMSTKPALHLLSHRVRILSVEKKDLPLVTHTLLNITLKLLANDSPHRRLVIPAGSVCI